MTISLTEFLRARLGEDEAAANEVHLPRECGSVDRDGEFHADPVYCSCGAPARVLREVAARRAVLAEHERIAGSVSRYKNAANAASLITMQTAVKLFAAVYSGHPDFRQEWKP